MFGRLFDPPHVKAERQAAKSLGTLRQKAAANLEIELRILSNAMGRAELAGNAQLQSGGTWNPALGDALYEAKEFISNIENAVPSTMMQLAYETRNSIITNQYADLLKLEGEIRDAYNTLTIEAGSHLKAIRLSTDSSFSGSPQQDSLKAYNAQPKTSIEDRIRILEMSLSSAEKK